MSKDSFTSFFSVWMPFNSFSCLIVLVGTSSTVVKRSSKNRYPCLVSDLRGNPILFLNLLLKCLFQVVILFLILGVQSLMAASADFLVGGLFLCVCLFFLFLFSFLFFL